MKIKFKSESFNNTRKLVKALWRANVKPKPLDVDKYVTLSSSLKGETREYISGFKSIIANYAKANGARIIIGSSKEKFNMNVFLIMASNEKALVSNSAILSPPYSQTHEKFEKNIFKSVEIAINKLNNRN